VSTNAREKFNTMFSKRSVLIGKFINLISFADYHIEHLFVRMGWKEFLEINEKSDTSLVQTFYANLTVDEDNVIHSRVDRFDVTLSINDIVHILALSSEGFDIFSEQLNSFEFYSKGEYHEIASQFLHNDDNPYFTLNDKVSLLTIPYQILAKSSCSIFFPNRENIIKQEGISLS